MKRSDYKRRSPENGSKADLRDKIQRRFRKSEERHNEHSKHKAKNENVERRERHLLDTDKKIQQINIEEKPTLRAYKKVSNGFESKKNKLEICIPLQKDGAKKHENLEDGEIIDENSTEASSPAEPITNTKFENVEQSNSETTPKDLNRAANRQKDPVEVEKVKDSEIDVKYKLERVFMPTKEPNSDSAVEISEVNCMKSVVLNNEDKLLKIDLSIKTENLSTNEPQVDKIQNVLDGCTSLNKSDEVSVNTALNTSGLLDTSKILRNISTSSTDYTLVEDDENNDVIIYVSRKKRKKKKSLGNH